jgi:hypothetical protein
VIRFTLVSDGSSDQALVPILTWVLRQAGVTCELQPQWADLRNLRKPPKLLRDKISKGVELFPCDLLFVHRDAENETWHKRDGEIKAAIDQLRESGFDIPHVCVVPVRMLEAWLLIDAGAIRAAAANPNGKVKLELPKPDSLEGLADPKEDLFQLIRIASGLTGRRLRKLSLSQARRRVAELMTDFSPLRRLSGFAKLEKSTIEVSKASHLEKL